MPPGEPRFGELAAEYDAFRVGYTAKVYEHLANRCGLASGADVVDLGCGNGLSTLPLIEAGATVTAVDSDPAMLRLAREKLGDGATVIAGRAERLPLESASYDLVLAAQAAHFFREPEASREIRRVLRPGGTVAYVWKYPAPDTPYVYLADELLTLLTDQQVRTTYGVGTVPELLASGWRGYRRAVFEQPVAYTIGRYVGYQSSRDRIRQLAGEHREDLLQRLDLRLRALEPSGAFVERNLAYVISAERDDGP
jgi:ubiquinone/menaquinone biosynthesis C-methylase UbiE